MRKLRSLVHKPSPAMLVALLALFVALGGSSYAALRIGSEQIRNNSVRSVDLRNNGVRGADVRTNTLTGSDIKESNLRKVPAARIANRARNSDTLDGKDATDFGPRAYARVTRSGSVDATNSRGLTSANVSHPSDGVYCFSGLPVRGQELDCDRRSGRKHHGGGPFHRVGAGYPRPSLPRSGSIRTAQHHPGAVLAGELSRNRAGVGRDHRRERDDPARRSEERRLRRVLRRLQLDRRTYPRRTPTTTGGGT
jgi:hypothetical protein